MVKRAGLGRNLSVLLNSNERQVRPNSNEPALKQLPIQSLQAGKYQPRMEMDEIALAELAQSIQKQGLLQPLVVREIAEGRYEIIAGERRWRASQIAGLSEIPVLVKEVDDETAMAMALIENIQREDLNVMDEARAMQRLCTEFALTHQQIAELLGKSRVAVSNALRLLQLTPAVASLLERGELDMGHARALLGLDAAQQQQVAELIVARAMTVRETEALIARMKSPRSSKGKAELAFPLEAYHGQLQQLAEKFKTKLQLKPSKSGKGAIQIHFNSPDQLDTILTLLMLEQETV